MSEFPHNSARSSEQTKAVQACLDRMRAGDSHVRGELIEFAFTRLERMTRRMKRDFDRVGRWEQTEDVLQNASLRLYEALGQVELTDVRHFYRLAALQIRRELIDLARHYQGPLGMGANHATARAHHPDQSAAAPLFDRAEFSADPQQIQQWGDFHLQVERLPDREREVFELLWYHELPQDEVAELLGLSTRQVKRIWRTAKLKLHDSLADRDTD